MAAVIRNRAIGAGAAFTMALLFLVSVATPAVAGDPAFEKGWRQDSLVSDLVYFNTRTRKTIVVAENDPCYQNDLARNYRKQAAACTNDIGMEEFNRPMVGFGGAERYYNRGNAYYEMGENAKAMADYNKALELQPNLHYLYNNRGLLYFREGEYDRAIADYSRALALNFETRPLINRGDAHFRRGDYRKAISDYAEAIRRPAGDFIKNSLGGFGPYRGDRAAARAEYRKAISGAYYKRGLAYRETAQFEKAAEDQKKAIGILRNGIELPGLDDAEE